MFERFWTVQLWNVKLYSRHHRLTFNQTKPTVNDSNIWAFNGIASFTLSKITTSSSAQIYDRKQHQNKPFEKTAKNCFDTPLFSQSLHSLHLQSGQVSNKKPINSLLNLFHRLCHKALTIILVRFLSLPRFGMFVRNSSFKWCIVSPSSTNIMHSPPLFFFFNKCQWADSWHPK